MHVYRIGAKDKEEETMPGFAIEIPRGEGG
jgi:hypothetical protein